MASRLKTVVKWMNDKGEEVSKGWATQALVAEYDGDKLVSETLGKVEAPDEK